MTIQNNKFIFFIGFFVAIFMFSGCSLLTFRMADEIPDTDLGDETKVMGESIKQEGNPINQEEEIVQHKEEASIENQKAMEVFQSNDYESITLTLMPEVSKAKEETQEELLTGESLNHTQTVSQNLDESLVLPEQKSYHVFDDITSMVNLSTSYENKPDGNTEIILTVEAPDMSHFFEWLSGEIDSYDDMASAIETYAHSTSKKQTTVSVMCDKNGQLTYSKEAYMDAVMGGFYSAYLEFCRNFFEMGSQAFGN